MVLRKSTIIIAACWLMFAIYFASYGADIFYLFGVFSLIFGLYFIISLKTKNTMLIVFMAFAFLSSVISAPFFFIRKDTFVQVGWFNAIGTFSFDYTEFYKIYFEVFVIVGMILLFTFLLDRVVRTSSTTANLFNKEEIDTREHVKENGKKYSLMLIFYIFVIFIPMCIFMYKNQVGLIGMENTKLPFKLSGILFYTRNYMSPIIVLYLYYKSNKSILLFIIVIVTALISGIFSISRGMMSMMSVPVIVISLVDAKYIRVILAGFVVLIMFAVVSTARIFVYSGAGDVYSLIVQVLEFREYFEYEMITNAMSTISQRLGGCQDVVLAYQQVLSHQFQAIYNYFSGNTVFANMAWEVYGMDFGNKAFGVNFGLLGWLVLLSQHNYYVMILLSFFIACLLEMFEVFLNRRLTHVISRTRTLSYALSFMVIFALFVIQIRHVYLSLLICIAAAYAINKRNKRLLCGAKNITGIEKLEIK